MAFFTQVATSFLRAVLAFTVSLVGVMAADAQTVGPTRIYSGTTTLTISNPTCAPLTGFSVRLRFDTGENHIQASSNWTNSTVQVSVSGGGTNLTNIPLTITPTNPESWYEAKFGPSGLPTSGNDLTLSATASAITSTGTAPAGIRVMVECVPEYSAVFPATSAIGTPPAPVSASGNTASFEYVFSWSPECTQVSNYQLQVLYVTESSINTTAISESEWQEKGLLIETGSSAPTYTLTLAEGIGYYHWRVRAIGRRPGGVADPVNLGPWAKGTKLEITASKVPNPNLNWIYNRTFTEGGRVSEKLTYANGLQQVRQTQTRLAGNSAPGALGQQVVATQTVQDYVGRDAVLTLPIPILTPNAIYLGYKSNLLKKSGTSLSYSAADFDSGDASSSTPNTFGQPLTADEQGYYSSNPAPSTGTSINGRVADAQGYPFTRTRFGPDGRIREQSGVGAAMKLQPESVTAHTTRTYYAAVAPQELIRLFGDEAPEATGTYKLLSIDPNNITSVSYQTKQGQTIATALSSAGSTSTGPLEPLPAGTPYNITEELATPARVVGKSLVITEPNSHIYVNYAITPAMLQNGCLPYCATCDYKVRITVTKLNDAVFTPQVRIVDVPAAPATSVCANPTTVTIGSSPWDVGPLAIGEYRIEREIMPADPVAVTPPTTPQPPAVPTIDARLAELQALLTNMSSQAPWSQINGYLSQANIDGLYGYLLGAPLSYPIVTSPEGARFIKIPLAASTNTACTTFINLPYKPDYCTPVCSIQDTDFETLLQNKLDEINTANRTSFDTSDVWGIYSADSFKQLLLNMELYGKNADPALGLKYTCQQLMTCWNAQLAQIESNLTVTGNSPVGYDYNFVKEFLACTGVDMTQPVDINTGRIDLTLAFSQFAYDSNSDYDKQCLASAFICQYEVNDPSRTNDPNFFRNEVQQDLPNFSQYRANCRSQAYECLTNRSTQTTATATFNGIDEANKAADEMMRTCRSACNDRRAEFRASIVDGFHDRGLYVSGDRFYLEAQAHGGYLFSRLLTNDELASLDFIEACQVEILVQALVKHCEEDCQVSVYDPTDPDNANPTGPAFAVGKERELTRMSMVMFNRYDLGVAELNEGCADPAMTSVVPTSNQLFHSELTSCAEDVVGYISALVRGVPRLLANPRRLRSCNVPTGTVAAALPNEDIFSVSGPLRKNCTQLNNTCLLYEASHYPGIERINNWVTIIDVRPTPSRKPNTAYDPIYDYSLVWSEEGHDSRGACDLIGDDAPGLPKALVSSCGRTGTPYDDGPFYQLRFMDESGVSIAKSDIQDVTPAFLDEPNIGSSLATGLGPNSLFTAEGVKVRLTLTDGSWKIARMVVSLYALRNSATPTPSMPSTYLQWKTTESCSIAQNKYKVCIKWHENPEPTTQGDGPVYTGEPTPCNEVLARELQQSLYTALGQWQQTQRDDLLQQYQTKCLALAGATEHFTLTYGIGYHHFTLYYYDRAGNLVRTVPPKGVVLLNDSEFLQAATATAPAPNFWPRSHWGRPVHTLVTRYTYNSLHQCVSQLTPDGGTTRFYHNRKGLMRFSQNALQLANSKYSYTKYDALGRVVEVGESGQDVTSGGGLGQVVAKAENSTYPTTGCQQVTTTVYSTPAAVTYSTGTFTGPAYDKYNNSPQRYLANRVSYTTLDVDGDPSTTTDASKTFYSYDPHGNVEWLIQFQRDIGSKFLRYEYDLISNKVLRVNYQEGQQDQFYHRYNYDTDNRLTEVYTSADGMIWDRDARYTYYAHGPLKRLELGEDHVQGLDYTYTLQGWLKAVNHPGTVATDDPGQDGSTTTGTGTDAYGMALHYYSGDYVTNATSFNYQSAQLQPVPTAQGLYNGNIRSWANATATHFLPGNNSVPIVLPTGPEGGAPPVQKDLTADAYTYDELNRLRSSSMYTNSSNSTWQATSNYGTSYSYDANGNLLTLHRDGLDNAQLQMDRLDYTYTPGTNRLAQVEDTTPDEPLYGGQDLTEGIHSYSYDDIGNLTVDAEAGTVVSWNVYGKVKQVVNAAKGMTVSYSYDPAGQRIGKRVAKTVNQTITTLNTYYVRDAQGNVFATYERSSVQNAGQNTATAGPLTLVEQPIYGSQRLGIRQLHLALGTSTATPGYYARQLGQKHYELSDHLGNVRAVVSDKLLSSGGTLVPELTAYYNYFAFGMLQPGHFAPGNTTSQGGYRYGFNGKEKDDNGEFGSTVYDYGSRIYNPTIGKWLSLDPLQAKYTALSPYNYVANNPNLFVDHDGKEITIYVKNEQGFPMPIPYKAGMVYNKSQTGGVDNQFARETIQALNRIHEKKLDIVETVVNGKKENVSAIDALVEAKEFNVRLEESSISEVGFKAGTGISWYDKPGGLLEFNSRSGTSDGKGNAISPAIGLIHEIGHAFLFFELINKFHGNAAKALDALLKLNATPDKQYTNANEAQTMQRFEFPAVRAIQEAAKAAGKKAEEGVRECYDCGEEYPTTGVFSTTRDESQDNKEPEKKK